MKTRDKGQGKCGNPAVLPLQRRGHRNKSHSAFTLLELILAMFVTCLLAAALYGSLWTAFKARDSAIGAVEPSREMQVAMELIGHDLQQALPMLASSANGQMSLIGPFEGEAEGTTSQTSPTVEFYAVLNGVDSNDPTQADGVKRIELEMVQQPDGTQALVENIAASLPGDQSLISTQQSTQATPVAKIISRNVESFSAQYSDGQNWNDTWDATAYTGDPLPMAVQITIQMKPLPGAKGRNGVSLTRTFALPAAVWINSSSGQS